jgi:multidrug resistance efflux pump
MRPLFASLGRLAVTAIVVAVAGLVAWQLWTYYMDEPWTRDGRLRADVVGVAPDVQGIVAEVLVRDNQPVRKGDVLFRIDRERFALAVRQADAVVASRRATYDEAVRERNRYAQLSSAAASQQKQEQTEAAAREAEATYRQAVADRAVAELNFERTEIRAPVDGTVTNFTLRPGDYVSAGQAVAALVDSDSFYVDGYFEETKLARIRVGAPVVIRLMGESRPLAGHVDSIAAGIEDRERAAGGGLLPNVNPTFSWVRLAQRVPVRIALDRVPDGVRLLTGRTATVVVLPGREATSVAER